MTNKTKSSSSVNGKSNYIIPLEILNDLCSRFIINIPEEERHDLIRVFFQIELAHWFYLDFYCTGRPELKPCKIKDFSSQVFQLCPSLIQHADKLDEILGTWRNYKMAVPTYGAVLLDASREKVLLVQGFWARASWGFPKGKVNENEKPHDCAIREVMEETGFDIGKLINVEEYLEFNFKMSEQITRLYIVPDVPLDTQFVPQTRNEIKKVEWFPVESLPAHRNDAACKLHHNLNPSAFYMIIPFIKPLRKWIAEHRPEAVMPLMSVPTTSENCESSHRPHRPHHRLRARSVDEVQGHLHARTRSGTPICADGVASGGAASENYARRSRQRARTPRAGNVGGNGESAPLRLYDWKPNQPPAASSPRHDRGHARLASNQAGGCSSRRCLAPQFSGRKSRHRKPAAASPFFSESLNSFRLNEESVMLSFLVT